MILDIKSASKSSIAPTKADKLSSERCELPSNILTI